MCMVVYLAADAPLPLISWDAQAPAFHVKALDAQDDPVRAQFSKPHVYYVGSHEGCGCGFGYGQWDGEKPDDQLAAQASVTRLADYVAAASRSAGALWQARPEVTPHPRRDHRVTNAEFAKLRAEVESDIGPLPPALGGLEPGDRFQPLLLRVPSRPTADFLWPGVGDLLASDRVRALWEHEGFTGAVFSRTDFERVGRRSPDAPLRPRGGEPEGALRGATAVSDPTGLSRYWHVAVTGTSARLVHAVLLRGRHGVQ